MKKILFKLLAALICVSFFVSGTLIFASNCDRNTEVVSDDCDFEREGVKTLEEQLIELLNDEHTTELQKKRIIEKLDFIEKLRKKDYLSIQSKSSYLLEKKETMISDSTDFKSVADFYDAKAEKVKWTITFYMDVPGYKQETTYYCGPATLKQTMQYINKRSLPQSAYASALGTTTAGTDGMNIIKYFNDNLRQLRCQLMSILDCFFCRWEECAGHICTHKRKKSRL